MRLLRLFFVTLLLSFVALPSLHAQNQPSPYTVTVPVPDTSDAQRSQAFATALGQVLTRVAGGQDLRSNPGYADAVQNASALVRKYQYQRAATGLSLDVDFDPSAVRRMVSTLGVASAGVKPPVLLLVQGSDGSLLGRTALASLASSVKARGTEVIYPDATSSLDLDKVAAADPATLAAINQRYHTGLVLVGKLRGSSADWTLLSGGQAQHWQSQGVSQDILLSKVGDSMVDRIGRQLNVIGVDVNNGKLWVGGLHSARDYVGLLSILRADPSVQKVTTVQAQDDSVMLDVKATLPLNSLAANLAAGGHLLLQDGAHPGADVSLRWLP